MPLRELGTAIPKNVKLALNCLFRIVKKIYRPVNIHYLTTLLKNQALSKTSKEVKHKP